MGDPEASPAPAPGRGRGAATGPPGAVRQELGSVAELAALVGFAVVQPVLGPFGESPETFVAVGASPATIVAFAVLVAVVPLAVVAGIGVAGRGFGARVRSWVQTVLVAVLAAMAVVALVRHAEVGAAARSAVAVATGLGVGALHRRARPLRLFLRYASPTPVALVAVFLLASPVAPLVRPPSVAVDRADGDHPPVVVIVLDELPTRSLLDAEGAIDGRLFPNLARFADTATWYRDHTTVSFVTAHAVPALASGRLPPAGSEQAPVHAEHPDTIFTLLAATHDVHAVEWVSDLCPTSLCDRPAPPIDDEAAALLASAPGDRADPLGRLVGEARSLWWGQVWPPGTPPGAEYTVAGAAGADEQTRPALEFISGLVEPDGDRPTFDYLHVPLPHQPWTLLPSGDRHDAPHPAGPEGGFSTWGDDELGAELAATARSHHLLQLQWTDRMLGTIFARLEALGRWDDAVVVVTADHGVSFEAGQPIRVLEPGNQVDIAWVPLLVKAPGQRQGAVVDDNVLSIDVLPTVADLVGVEVPWAVDGRSLAAGGGRGDPTKPVLSHDPSLFAVELADGLVGLDADGLAVLRAGSDRPAGPDELLAWRHGRHGDLLGRAVDELGTCGPGRPAPYRPPEGWDRYRDGGDVAPGEALPIWHEGTVADTAVGDLAAVVDGVVVSWSPTTPAPGGRRFGFLLAEPLVRAAGGDPVLYEVTDGDGCRLRPVVGPGG